MARISQSDLRIVEDALGSASGYVADFTNNTFSSFFAKEVGAAIYGDAYAKYGTSKGKRLRAFLEEADDALALKALRALRAYVASTGWRPDGQSPEEHKATGERLDELIERLSRPRESGLGEQDLLAWLVRVQRKLREIQQIAFKAYDDANDTKTKDVPDGIKQALSAHYAVLKEHLPSDFPPSAFGDMGRHIHFSDHTDMRSIAGWDVPDLMAKAEKYALEAKAEVDDDPRDVLNLIDEMFLSSVEQELGAAAPDYHMLVLKCCLLLGKRFADKTGLEDDLSSYGKAFGPKTPMLLVPVDLKTATRQSQQQGAMFLFQGYRSFLRNTHAHDIAEGDRDFSLQAIVFLSMLAEVLAAATVVAETEERPATTSASS